MSLVNCPECEHVVSTYAIACPNCGFPMELAPQLLAGETVPAVSAEPSHAPLSVGSFVSLGRWGGIELEWRVLHVEEDRALMVTEDGIECLPYNDKESNVTWETCSLRAWPRAALRAPSFRLRRRTPPRFLCTGIWAFP